MYKVVGKAYYSVTFEGKVYNKIRFSLMLDKDSFTDKFTSFEGDFYDTVCVKANDVNTLPSLGDYVVVSYNRYGKPDSVLVVK